MKPTTDIVEELRLYNRWRRGDEAITAPDPTALGKLLDDAADRIEHLFASGIHTCHADCQRPMCVLRRERDKAHADLARVTAERDEAKSEAESALDTCARTLDERDALRARVAELEQIGLNNGGGFCDCMDFCARRDGFLKATGLPYQDRTACSHVKAAFRVFGMSRILATMAKMGYGYGGAE